MDENTELLKQLGERIQGGKQMIEGLKLLEHVEGVDKFARKINQEIRFLKKVQSTGNVKKDHLQSTNLIHLSALVDRLHASKNPVSVIKPFKFEQSRLEVDIVDNNGSTWVKVIARNARALTLISLGNGEYGQKSVLHQAAAYLKCAALHPHMYKIPEVIFHFAYGIETPLAIRLKHLGVLVEGENISCSEVPSLDNSFLMDHTQQLDFSALDMYDSDCENDQGELKEVAMLDPINSVHTNEIEEIRILNLDVSTLLAYVTNMVNGHTHFKYREPLLTMQAEWERSRPVKPILDQIFQGKTLIVCRTAYDNFTNIIRVIGGPNESRRSKEFMRKVTIVPDDPCDRIMKALPLGGRIKDRSRLVFATGENMKSITVSANEGFVRAARMQGIECSVFLHEPRSLSEMKEINAQRLNLS
ncbi:UPF0415 protein C7orf25 homolog [Neodiprion pinetum]|uniref:UPF0415 protein C7orf25 homolog n=1 Tax=Neodiprion lecontei TaxID=441921 RepID=A0A6J0BCU4_NEOLC|nr:UPF0415 protein C7orf25 homolog [Neodiprion lecontei]XP_046487111.1 UPF0415 protein C7orf25 homolog [Neodiprion pinetum]